MTENQNLVVIFGGGTVQWFANHLALSVPHFGGTARSIYSKCKTVWPQVDLELCLTKMARDSTDMTNFNLYDEEWVETNKDVEKAVEFYLNKPETTAIFFSVEVLDYHVAPLEKLTKEEMNKHGIRFQTRVDSEIELKLVAAEKLIKVIKKKRSDVFLVGFKQSSGFSESEQIAGARCLIDDSLCDLVLSNDSKTRCNIVVEKDSHYVASSREEALTNLVNITKSRCND